MTDKALSIKMVLGTIGGILVSLLGGWDLALQVLVIFVCLDYLTGVIAAAYQKRLDSNIGFKGITKKICLFIPIAIAYWLDIVLGAEVFRSLAVFFYIANEGLSILENLGRVGVPLPSALSAALEQLKDKSEGGKQ